MRFFARFTLNKYDIAGAASVSGAWDITHKCTDDIGASGAILFLPNPAIKILKVPTSEINLRFVQ